MRTMQFSYDMSFRPPAPVVEISLSQPSSQDATQVVSVRGLIDSGADITVVPQWVINQLKLYPVDEVLVAGYIGEATQAWLYSVAVAIAEFGSRIIRVVGSPNSPTILIGRDVINEWTLLLDGRQQVFKIISGQ